LARRSTVWSVAIALAGAATLFLLWYGREVLFMAFAGILVGIFLSSLSDWIRRFTRIPYRWSLAIVVLSLLGVIGLSSWLVGHRIAQQMAELTRTLPQSSEQIRQQIEQYEWGQWVIRHAPEASSSVSEFDLMSQVTGLASRASGFLVGMVIVLFVGIYTALEPDLYQRGIVLLVPLEKRERAREVITAVGYNLRWWMLGQLFSMAVVGMLIGLGLWWLGVPLALTLGLLAGAAELVPNVGPVVAAAPGVMVALANDGKFAIYVIVLYVVVQFVESYLLMPLVQRSVVWLPPAVTILAIVLLGIASGLLGVLVAAPLTVTIIILVKMLYVEDLLGDRSITVLGEPER
jgi:predicted PurR-regulated permease PerM